MCKKVVKCKYFNASEQQFQVFIENTKRSLGRLVKAIENNLLIYENFNERCLNDNCNYRSNSLLSGAPIPTTRSTTKVKVKHRLREIAIAAVEVQQEVSTVQLCGDDGIAPRKAPSLG